MERCVVVLSADIQVLDVPALTGRADRRLMGRSQVCACRSSSGSGRRSGSNFSRASARVM